MAEETRSEQEARPEPLSVLWRILAAPQTSLVLAGFLALALSLASVVPQIPPQAMDDPQAWLATQPAPLGRRGGLIATLGLYDVYHGLWFRMLLALTAVVLFVRLVDAADWAWRARRRGAPGSSGLGWQGQPPRAQVVSSLSLEVLQGRLYDFLDRHGYRYAMLSEDAPARWLVTRWPALLWIRPLGYAALLLAIAGLTLGSYWGWQDEVWRPLPGETRLVGHGSPYTLRLDRFEMLRDPQGRLEDYASRVTWLEGSYAVQETVASARQPASFRGLNLHQVGYLPMVELQAWDGDGNPLALEPGGDAQPGTGPVEIRFLEAEDEPLVFIPAQEQLLALVFEPMCQQGQPALHVDLVGGGGNGRERLATLTTSSEVTGRDLQLRIHLDYRPMLRLDRRPGSELTLAGMALAVLALLVGWMAPPRLMGIALEPRQGGGFRIQIISSPGARVRQWLAQLAIRLEGALADDD